MKEYSKIEPDIGKLILESMKNHLWHLTEQFVVTALVDEDLPGDERKKIAKAIFE